ncbi:MAG: hypothetical protein ABSE22_15595 [Xanthobacteraceae bacterium]|jgi:hypothetical protein
MRRLLIAAFAFAALLSLADSGFAQQGLPLPPGGFKPPPPPPPAPIKPYKPVAVTPPAPLADPSFVAFRKQLADTVAHKDRAGLAKLVVAKGFFWLQDKDLADPHKSGIDNLAKATDLDAKDGPGWDLLTGFANEPTAAESPDQKGVFCGPADPTIDPNSFEALNKATATDPSEWGYPVKDGLDVHAAAQQNSPVIEKLGLFLVRVLPDSGQPTEPNQPPLLHVATPSGKSGFVDAESVAPLGGDQMCYSKDASGWKIAGYLGGASQ